MPSIITGAGVLRILKLSVLFLIPAIGELYNQRGGVMNIGIEGMMLTAALGATAIGSITGNLLITIVGAIGLSLILALFSGLLTISWKVDQVVVGLGIWIFAMGITTYIGGAFEGPVEVTLPTLNVGEIGVGVSPILFLGFILVPIFWYVLNRTQFGLKVKATGEDPRIAEIWGANVTKIRFIGMIIAGITAGIGGLYLSMHYSTVWSPQMTAGRGWMAFALVFFCLHSVKYLVLGSLFFGTLWITSTKLQFLNLLLLNINILRAIPYLATIIALVIVAIYTPGRRQPDDLGNPYWKE